MRRKLVAGNWKMFKTLPEALALAMELKQLLADCNHCDVVIAPPFVVLEALSQKFKGTQLQLAGQNLHAAGEGAFTGEISGAMLKSVGCSCVLIGHSERRQYFKETDEEVNAKIRSAIGQGLTPIFCLGETLAEREAGTTFQVLEKQLTAGLAGIPNERAGQVVIAYEPVWAIGTGKVASTEQAQEVHKFLRERLGAMYRSYVPATVRILYGGSVKPENVDAIMAQPDLDGVLVGGASLKAKDFARIAFYQKSAG